MIYLVEFQFAHEISLFSFQEWMPLERGCINDHNSNALFLIRCAYEIQDVRVVELFASLACEENDEEYKTFCLEYVDIAAVESTALFEFLSSIKNLQKLKMHLCRMEDSVIRELATKLLIENSDNCKLTELDISANILKDEGAKYLSEALKNDNCKLTELNISNNEYTAEGAKYLSDALKSIYCKLTKLNISGNELKDKGAKYLSDALKNDNCKLTELNISYNKLTAEGAKYLSDALKSDNCKLTKLNIMYNELKDEGAKYLSDALKSENCKLTKLYI